MRVLLCIALLFLSSLSNVQADKPTQVFPLEYYLTPSDYLNVELSPDGKHYASLVRDNGSVYLLIKETESKKLVGGARPGSGNEIKNIRWVSNEHLTYTLGYEYRRNDAKNSRGEIFMVNLSGTFNSSVAGYRNATFGGARESRERKAERLATYKVVDSRVDDPTSFFAIAYPWKTMRDIWVDDRQANPLLMRISTSSSWKDRVRRVEELPFKESVPVVEPSGLVRFLHRPNESAENITMYRKDADSEWLPAQKVFGDLFSGRYPVSFNQKGDKLYLFGLRENSEVETLFEYRFADQTLHEVFDNKVSLFDWSNDSNGEPYIGYSYPGDAKYHYSKTNSRSLDIGIHQTFQQSFKGNEVRVLMSGNGSDKRIVFVHSSSNPGEYYLYDLDTGAADFIQAYSSWIDPEKLVSKEPIKYISRDNREIRGYLSRPSEKLPMERHPVVVLLHGGPHGVRDLPDYQDEVQVLVNRGFAVLQINYRGSSGITREFEEAGYRNWGTKIVDDIVDSQKFIKDNPELDDGRVCLLGASFGGYAALMALAKTEEVYRCAIASSGIFDLPLLYQEGDVAETEYGVNYLKKVIGEDKKELIQNSPVSLASQINEPVLLIHGARDSRAPIEHSHLMREALENNENEPRWLKIGSAGHGAVSLKNRRKEFSEVVKFLKEHLSPKK